MKNFIIIHKLLSWLQRWKNPFALFLAVLCPGVPQLLRKHMVLGCILGIFGTGALLQLLMGIWLSWWASEAGSVFRTFDLLYAKGMPTSWTAFPDLQAFAGESQTYLIQPWFWHLLIGYLVIYVVCTIISGWQQWKDIRTTDRSASAATLPR